MFGAPARPPYVLPDTASICSHLHLQNSVFVRPRFLPWNRHCDRDTLEASEEQPPALGAGPGLHLHPSLPSPPAEGLFSLVGCVAVQCSCCISSAGSARWLSCPVHREHLELRTHSQPLTWARQPQLPGEEDQGLEFQTGRPNNAAQGDTSVDMSIACPSMHAGHRPYVSAHPPSPPLRGGGTLTSFMLQT